MTENKSPYDWASAALSVEECNSTNLRQLVSAANLDAENGDLSDVDLSNMDLRGQDLSNWDLGSASFEGARLAGADLSGSKINFDSLTEAEDWQEAKLDDADMIVALETAVRKVRISNLELSIRASNGLRDAGIINVGQLMKWSAGQLLRIPNFGRKSLNELKEVLNNINIVYGEEPRLLNDIMLSGAKVDEVAHYAAQIQEDARKLRLLISDGDDPHPNITDEFVVSAGEIAELTKQIMYWKFVTGANAFHKTANSLLEHIEDLKQGIHFTSI